MRAVMLEVPSDLLEERVRLGLDTLDELWDGVLHMVPPPRYRHQNLGSRLLAFLQPRLEARGIELLYESGVFRPGSDGRDYRVPDLVFFRPDQPGLVTERGIEGPPLVVLELLSPGDETYEKFDFWAALGVPEIVVIDPESRRVELFRLAGQKYLATSADDGGRLHLQTLDVRLATVAGKLHVEVDGETTDI